MSTLTRISSWLVLLAMIALGLLFLYVKFAEPTSSQRQITFEPKAGATYVTGQTPSHQVVAEFAQALRRHAGRKAVSESDLPFSREEIRQAIIAAPKWAKDFHSPGGYRFFGALLVELENFVPDLKASAMEEIWERQRDVIASLGQQYRLIAFTGEKPIPIGGTNEALKAMLREREAQYAGFLAVFVFFGFLGFKLLTQLFKVLTRRPRDHWSGWKAVVFFLLSWFTGAVGYPVAWLGMLIEDAMTDATMRKIGGGLVIALGETLDPDFSVS